MKLRTLTTVSLLASAAFSGTAMARDQVQVAGSSTVLPYAKIVAENFGETYPDFKTPVIESGGSSGGLKEFCKGVGTNTIDVANASRKIKDKEIKACQANGVKDIEEIRIGYDGIVFASDINGPDFSVTPKDIYLALAAKVPAGGKMVANPNKKWSDVNKAFPEWPITAYIPGEKHGTREVFEEKLLEAGCEETGAADLMKKQNMGKDAIEEACIAVRKDGASVDIDGDYTETLSRIEANKQGVGVFGLAFYENNTDKLKVATVSGIKPSVETIASGEYPVSRPLYFYVKKAHLKVIPGLKEYVKFFISDSMVGPDSPLAEYGLVPAPEAERKAVRKDFKQGKTL